MFKKYLFVENNQIFVKLGLNIRAEYLASTQNAWPPRYRNYWESWHNTWKSIRRIAETTTQVEFEIPALCLFPPFLQKWLARWILALQRIWTNFPLNLVTTIRKITNFLKSGSTKPNKSILIRLMLRANYLLKLSNQVKMDFSLILPIKRGSTPLIFLLPYEYLFLSLNLLVKRNLVQFP